MRLIFKNKLFLISVVLLLIQQLIVASSTVFIVKLGNDIINNNSYLASLTLFFSSLVIVYIPAVTSFLFMEKSKVTIITAYVNLFHQSHINSYFRFLDKNKKKQTKSWLTSEAQKVIEDSTFFFYTSLSTALNLFLSALVIIIEINHQFIYPYLFSVLIIILSIKLTNKSIVGATREELIARNNYRQILTHAWDNILTGNQLNFDIWKEKHFSMAENLKDRITCYAKTRHLFGSIAMAAALCPILGFILYLFLSTNDKAIMIALAITLPRQIQIIQSIQTTVDVLFQLKSYRTKLSEMMATLTPSNLHNQYLNHLIQWKKITMNGQPIYSINTILQLIKQNKIRRSTLRGGNGTGKSLILKQIKQIFPNAYYMPSDPSGLLFDYTSPELSTGQFVISAIEEVIAMNNKPELLLLDEWDANLDDKNRARIDELLGTADVPIIEVRHIA
ncbi:MAG: ATP-binding cassette domain-containing protein [Endozoicomonas sp.]|uniref:ATP-binding cassette domain-containing protein n=1 Tax=Endozoicomonas sp. TaxID=1892382 RepID=UPI003D9BE750